jgi:exopolysaccharide production protein ExoQ
VQVQSGSLEGDQSVYPRPGRPAAGGIGWRSLLRDVVALGWLGLSTAAVYVLLVLGTEPILRPEQEALLRLFVLPALPLAGLVFLVRARDITELLLRLPTLLLFLVLMWSSIAWSLDPLISLRRATLLSAYTVLAVWLVVAYQPAALLRRLVWLFLAILLLSAAFAVLLPGLAWQPLDGRLLLRGVFSHKNELGAHLGMSAILMATAWQFRLIPRWAAGLGLVLCITLAWPTGSATTYLVLAMLAVVRIAIAIASLPGRLAAPATAFAVAMAIFATLGFILFAEPIVAALGRDLTLTGRVPLWQFVWLQISREPWLGYGFAIFFEIDWVRLYTLETLNWPIPNAHNGYLEVWLGVGIAGPVLLTLFLLRGLGRALLQLRHQPTPGAVFAVYVIATYLLRNVVESDLATATQISWVLVVIAVTITLKANEGERISTYS